jgi:hypothetical protein
LVAQVPRVNGVHTHDATLHVDTCMCRLHDDGASELRKSDRLHNGSCACLPTTQLPQVHHRQRSGRSPPPVRSLSKYAHTYGYTHEQSLAPWHAWPSCTSPETKSLNRFNVLVAQVPRVNGVRTHDATLHVDSCMCWIHNDGASELRKSDRLHNGSCACLPTTQLSEVHQRQRSARSPPPVLSL